MKKILFFSLVIGLLFAEEKADSLGNNLPLEPTRTISFTTDEGTWMSLDVSPDGKSIIFDLVWSSIALKSLSFSFLSRDVDAFANISAS